MPTAGQRSQQSTPHAFQKYGENNWAAVKATWMR